jgi:hypothetical protein
VRRAIQFVTHGLGANFHDRCTNGTILLRAGFLNELLSQIFVKRKD